MAGKKPPKNGRRAGIQLEKNNCRNDGSNKCATNSVVNPALVSKEEENANRPGGYTWSIQDRRGQPVPDAPGKQLRQSSATSFNTGVFNPRRPGLLFTAYEPTKCNETKLCYLHPYDGDYPHHEGTSFIWKRTRRLEYWAHNSTETTDCVDTASLTPKPITLKKCPCFKSRCTPNKSTVPSTSVRRPFQGGYYDMKRVLSSLPCLNRPSSPEIDLSSFSKLTIGTDKGSEVKTDFPEKMFEAMVDELRNVMCVNSLDNYRALLKKEHSDGKLNPIELFFRMGYLCVDTDNDEYNFLIGQLMLRATYRKKIELTGEQVLERMITGKRLRWELPSDEVIVPMNILPDRVTNEMVDGLYKTILLRMDPKNARIKEWFGDPNPSKPNDNHPTVPTSIKELRNLATSFFTWAFNNNDCFIKKFVLELDENYMRAEKIKFLQLRLTSGISPQPISGIREEEDSDDSSYSD